MVASSISMAIASMAAWFTPIVLFCATNLIIATIFIITSNTTTTTTKHHRDHSHTPLFSRVSSFLDRTRSIKLPFYPHPTTTTTTTTAESQSHHQHPPQPKTPTYGSTSRLAQSIHLSSDNTVDSPGQLVRTPSFLERIRSFKISSTKPETVCSDPNLNVVRSKSEKTSAKKTLVEMKKSRSEMGMATEDGEDVELRRPATARERRKDEVDARADDFISRFKQQLRLQRLESLVRYNEMVNRRR